ncbi:Protein-export membrane protein SecD [Halorhabdus tiamatea SARL4B]|uniref:Protein-export membrane protein SecD n=1 Tax=Halorhabdus tiamatea SARL4B TaxID=1033806 RepID=F7PM19_9EURY|nr:preprotein translocase subunit SecD [Halorhabdus tiamatea]ERJ06372.1 Protein-export membrane protein SecD [Halorhabdus tiamatea SARL4B]CCQ34540.1 preprotein translocase subunit SecD [Halorhabdus tiamatea SARL4B]
MNVRENWQIVLLVVFVVGSGIALFAPVAGGADDGGFTNLQYGIQLDGGTSLQAPAVGITAEGVNVSAEDQTPLAQDISETLSLDPIDVRTSAGSQTVEVFTRNVTQDQLRDALVEAGYQPERVRDGVTSATREQMVRVIRDKISESALSGGSVSTIQSIEGPTFISITAPDRDQEELQALLDERGVVRVYAVHPDGNGSWVRDNVLSQEDFSRISPAQRNSDGNPVVPVTIRDSVADRFQDDMVEYGFGQARQCQASTADITNVSEIEGYCLAVTLNDNVVFAGGVQANLASSFASGDFATDPRYQMITGNMSEANELEISLRAGRLPAPLDFENARSQSLEPSMGEQFRTDSLLTGIMAVFAVSGMIYFRYRDARVALPMIVTAMSEVFILLGFVALVQYPLNLSHIAGFIAVIGTGADDLIIIADEILQREEIATDRVFQNRFRKAFWVIGAAAATTILAMSPLTVLSLGDLSGFAIITIVGVLIGVLITRPAYGNFLRRLVLDA